MRFVATFLIILLFSPTVLVAQNARNLERDKAAAAQSGKRIALVIGNGAYQKVSPLGNSVNDATDIAAVLTTLGFEVIKSTDTNLAQMRRPSSASSVGWASGVKPSPILWSSYGHSCPPT